MRILIVAMMVMFAGVAQAQTQPKRFTPTGNFPADIANAVKPGTGNILTGNIEKDARAIWDKIITASNADLIYASAMAGAAGTAASKTRKLCWDSILAVNQQASGSTLKNADGTPMVKPDPDLFTKLESLAEVIDNLSPQGQLYTSCAGAAQLAKRNVLEFIMAAVTGAAALSTGAL